MLFLDGRKHLFSIEGWIKTPTRHPPDKNKLSNVWSECSSVLPASHFFVFLQPFFGGSCWPKDRMQIFWHFCVGLLLETRITVFMYSQRVEAHLSRSNFYRHFLGLCIHRHNWIICSQNPMWIFYWTQLYGYRFMVRWFLRWGIDARRPTAPK